MSIYKEDDYNWSSVDDIMGIIDTLIDINSDEHDLLENTITGKTKDVIFNIPENAEVKIVMNKQKNSISLFYDSKEYILRFKLGLYVYDYF
jgi:hypothetical protein